MSHAPEQSGLWFEPDSIDLDAKREARARVLWSMSVLTSVQLAELAAMAERFASVHKPK